MTEKSSFDSSAEKIHMVRLTLQERHVWREFDLTEAHLEELLVHIANIRAIPSNAHQCSAAGSLSSLFRVPLGRAGDPTANRDFILSLERPLKAALHVLQLKLHEGSPVMVTYAAKKELEGPFVVMRVVDPFHVRVRLPRGARILRAEHIAAPSAASET